jgi:hypothetical protein
VFDYIDRVLHARRSRTVPAAAGKDKEVHAYDYDIGFLYVYAEDLALGHGNIYCI